MKNKIYIIVGIATIVLIGSFMIAGDRRDMEINYLRQGISFALGEEVGEVESLEEVIHINYQTNKIDLGDGKFAQSSSLGFENYKDGEEFKPIDMTLIDYGTYWKTTESIYYPTIPKYSNEWFEFRNVYEGNDHTIRTKPVADKVLGVLNTTDNKVVYEDAFGIDIDLEVYPYNSHLLKKIVINKPQTKDLYFDFELEIDDKLDYKSVDSEGLKTAINSVSLISATNLKEQLIEFEEDKSPTFIYLMRVWDSNNSVEYIDSKIYEDNGKMYLRKVISKEFLKNAVYPVYTDDDTGATSPGTMGVDTSIGTVNWAAPDDAKISDGSYAATLLLGYSGNLIEVSIRLVKGGTIQGDDKSTGAVIPLTDEYISYGGSEVLWGLEWSDTDINSETFGAVFAGKREGESTSAYLNATNFGFDISGTIDGILLEIEEATSGTNRNIWVDHMRITVYYTAVTDTCTYTSGDWNVDCSDNCTISSLVTGDGSDFNAEGSGTFDMNANVEGFDTYHVSGGCVAQCAGGCFK